MTPADPTPAVRVRVPAKINLHLAVGPLRDDGFHDIRTVFQSVGLDDDVTAGPGRGISLRVRGDVPGAGDLPTDEGNLAWRAVALLAEVAGVPADVALQVHKRIPIAGGLAGGSADAAATLVACARLWGLGGMDLAALAARLGSDVAFALLGGTAVGTGRGERLTAVATRATLHWVLAPLPFGLSTAESYATLDRVRAEGTAAPTAGSPDRVLAALADGDVPALAAALANDLQPVALLRRPELAALLAAGCTAGALAGIVSGSGPTCAFLCVDARSAAEVAEGLAGHGAFAVTGPVPGAAEIETGRHDA